MFKYPKENINAIALEYMEQKYGEKFEYYMPFGDSMTGTHELLVRCDSFPEQNILVRIENYRKDDKVFLDNYLAVKYYDDTVKFLDKCTRQVFTEANVFYRLDPQALSPELTVNTSFEEFLADTKVPLHFLVEVKVSEYSSEHQIQKLAELLSKHGSYYHLSVVIVNDAEFGAENVQIFLDKMFYRNYVHCAKASRLYDKIEIWWLEEE